MKHSFAIAVVALVAITVPKTPLGAQTAPPAVTMAGTGHRAAPLSAAEAAFRVRIVEADVQSRLSYKDAHYPKDSVQTVMTSAAQGWLSRLQGVEIRGIQIEPHGTVMVSAGQEAHAKEAIAQRLATAGLSVPEKAYTYLAAVLAFAKVDFPQRLPAAEAYAEGLDSLGAGAAFWQFTAHRALQGVYYTLGKSSDVARHGLHAIAVANQVPFYDRGWTVYSPGGSSFYGELIDALSGQPGGRAKIDMVNTTLKAGAIPSAAQIALDSNFYWQGHWYQQDIQGKIKTAGRIGTKAQDIQGNYWVNLTKPGAGGIGAHAMRVAAGKITIMEVGSFTCPGCVTSLSALQRLQRRFPMIQTAFATWTLGSWSNRLVETTEEAEKLKEQFTQRNKITDVPISIWTCKKVVQEDDGLLPESAGPNLANYPMSGKPNFYVIDGKGVIRLVHLSGLDRDTETQFARTVEFLLKEEAR
jgi:hypothetical protein